MTTGTSNHSRSPKVVIDEMVYQQIMHWVNKSNYEVSGLGKVVVDSDGTVRVLSAYLLPQKNSHTTTDIEAADVGKLAYLTRDEPGELKFWWHSHVNMPVFWSGTDIATINELGQHGWFVHIVFNKRHETRCAISMGDPFPALIDHIPLSIERKLDADLVASWDKEYDNKVTNVVPKSTAVTTQRFPQAQRHVTGLPNLSAEDRAEIARLARIMTEDENPNFPGLGADGVYHDADSFLRGLPNSLADDEEDDDAEPGRRSEHSKSASVDVGLVLKHRDKLEDAIERMEQKIGALNSAGAQIPKKLQAALDTKIGELNEVDDELDQLVAAGFLTDEDRFGPQFGRFIEQ